MEKETLLKIENLKTYFPIYEGIIFRKIKAEVKAVDDVSLEVKRGEILGLVGESGCGKSTLGRTVMQLAEKTGGTIHFKDKKLGGLNRKELRESRLNFQMIFQDPAASLDPRMTVFDTLAEPLLTHKRATKKDIAHKVSELMEIVGLAPRFMRKYPHEFSGGQRQRIAVARALALNPELIIADEPVSALDVSIQSQILNLLNDLVQRLGLTMIFISHDLSVIKYISDRVAVMYLGKIVELGDATQIIERPKHPYTKALISAIPLPDPEAEKSRHRVLLEGDPPSPISPPSGCRFHPRCSYAKEACKKTIPELHDFTVSSGKPHQVACIRAEEIADDLAKGKTALN